MFKPNNIKSKDAFLSSNGTSKLSQDDIHASVTKARREAWGGRATKNWPGQIAEWR